MKKMRETHCKLTMQGRAKQPLATPHGWQGDRHVR